MEEPSEEDKNASNETPSADGDEQKKEEGEDSEDTSGNKETPDIDLGEKTDSEQPADDISDEEAQEPADEVAAPKDEEPSDSVEIKNQIMAVEPAKDISITVEQYEKGDGQATDKKLDGNAVAEVTFIDGTSADDSKALGGERPVQFRLDMKDGWKTEGLVVSYTIAKSGDMADDKTETITASSDIYTVPINVDASGSGDDATPAGYSGNITIKIAAVPTKSTVKLSAAAGDGVNVYLVKADGMFDTENAITNENGQDLTYAESNADVTLAVSGLTGKYKNIKVKIGSTGGDKTIYASGTKVVGTDADAKTYDLFTFKPSEQGTLNKNTDSAVTVTLGTSEAAYGLTLALDSDKSGKWEAAAVTPAASTTEAYITIKDGAFDVSGIEGGLNEDNYASDGEGQSAKKRVLVFKVTPDTTAQMKLKGDKPVTAVLTANADESNPKKAVQTLEATFVPAVTGDNPVDAYYKIDLSTLTKTNFTGAMTLTIKVDTEVNPEGEGVHKISFAGEDLKNVTLGQKVASSFEELTNPYTAKMNSITFGIKPDDGYELKKGTDYKAGGTSTKTVVTVSYDKVYALQTTDDTPKDVTATVKVTDEEVIVEADTNVTNYLATEFKFEDAGYTDAAWKNGLPTGTTEDKISTTGMAEGKATFTKENVVVTVKTELASEMTGTVEIVSDEADYVVSGDGITKKVGDIYEISEEATLLTLNITSDVKPSVTYGKTVEEDEDGNETVTYGNKEAVVKEAEGGFVVEIPVSELAKTGSVIDDTIEISKGTKNLTVMGTIDDGAEEAFTGDVYVNGEEKWLKNGVVALTNGLKATVTVVAPNGTELVSVDKVVGDGEAEAVEVAEDKSSATFPVTMTDNVNVNVALKSAYTASVTVGGSAAEKGDDGVYVIKEGSSDIKVSLFKGANTEAKILYAKVYDGEEIAVTKATINNNVASITSISDKDTGVLRVDLASVDTKKVVASVKIRQEKAAAELTVKDAKNKAVTSVTLMADGPAAEFTVSAASGRLDYANIGVEVVAKADEAPAATPAASNDYVQAAYADGKLTITAKPAKEGKDDAAVIRLYDVDKRAAAASDTAATDKICLMASAITVKTTNPSVVGQKPVVKEATGTDKTLKVELSTTDKVVEPASANKVFYKVTIEGTLAGTLTDADKTQYIEKTAWGKNSQIAEIVVDNTTVDAQGNRVEGSAKDYALKVELVQTTGVAPETAASAVTAATAAAENTANTLALGGQVAELKKISTRNPLYETKLKMKPTSVTVYTGQTLEKVAKPQTQAQFDKKTGLTMVPYVQFVNTKTGVLLGTASNAMGAGGVARNGSWAATVDDDGNIKIG